MKGRELIELLQHYLDHEVICASDGEGNQFSPLSDTGAGVYFPEDARTGSVLNPDEVESETTAAERSRAVPCVVLWPKR